MKKVNTIHMTELLSKTDNIYKIKANNLYFHDRLIKGLFNVC